MSDIQITINEFAIKGAYEGARKAILETMIKIHAAMVPLTPVDTAQLANSEMWKMEDEEGGFNTYKGEKAREDEKISLNPKGLVGYVGTNSDHAVYQEFGTRHMKAQPFARPAAEIIKGGNAAEVGKKYGREAMQEAFNKRKVKKING